AGVRDAAVRLACDQGGTVAPPGAGRRFLQRGGDGGDVIAVYGDARETVALSANGDILDCELLPHVDGDRVLVVLDDENYRQFVDAGEVHRFVAVAGAGSAVACVADA